MINVLWNLRARSDYAHVSDENVEKLWEFVEFGLAQEFSGSGYSIVASYGQLQTFFLGINSHCAEFENSESSSMPANTLLSEEDRAAGIQFYPD
ncbi:hypothetical protein OF001_U190030 [Pseudomonas sp. OF001]|nr:hypothetical protein OF001_U190030 [Pseudomonas sp. OF001]